MENNTDQQLREDALAAVERLDQNTVIELIQTYLTKRWHQNDFWRSSLQYFYEKGTVSGSLFQSLETMIKQAGFLVSIAARKQSLSELSEKDKQIKYLQEAVDQWQAEVENVTKLFEAKDRQIKELQEAGIEVGAMLEETELKLQWAKKQIEELKAWNTEQASIIESFMQEIERLKADKKQVEWIAASDMDKLIDGEIYCVYYQKGDTKARVTAEYKNGKWLMHWARAVVDITDSVTHHQEFPPPPASLSPQTPEP